MTNRRIIRWTKEPKVEAVEGCKNLRDNKGEFIAVTSGLSDEMEDASNAILFAHAGEMWELINGLCITGDRTELINKINRAYSKHLKDTQYAPSKEA